MTPATLVDPYPGAQGDAMTRVTLQTIADKVGTSRMTVSNAFSRPDQLSSDLRARILAVADELGYVGPDPAARALARGTTGAVGVLLTDSLHHAFSDDVATGFLGAFVDALTPMGLALTLLTSLGTDDSEIVPARDVAVDGAVVYSCKAAYARDWLIRRKLPLVDVDQDPDPGIASVNVDDRGGAHAAARHLVDLGHRRFGLVTLALDEPPGPLPDPRAAPFGHPQRQRLLGWMDATDAAGITPTVVQIPDDTATSAGEAARMLLDADDPPTAVLCFSDVMALGIIHAVHERGLAVPGDVSVIGFDDNPIAQFSEIGLTTVRQDVTAKGRLAAETLMDAIEHDRAGTESEVRHHHLPTTLVVRASTAPPPR
jgi:DNA-binding LacI/PurR family transcriptional regulator